MLCCRRCDSVDVTAGRSGRDSASSFRLLVYWCLHCLHPINTPVHDSSSLLSQFYIYHALFSLRIWQLTVEASDDGSNLSLNLTVWVSFLFRLVGLRLRIFTEYASHLFMSNNGHCPWSKEAPPRKSWKQLSIIWLWKRCCLIWWLVPAYSVHVSWFNSFKNWAK